MTTKQNTKTVSWRKLRFHSVTECKDEVLRIVKADQEGRLSATGNWTPGQILSHLAAWIEYAYDGYPVNPPPFFIRWILKLRLKKMLDVGMPRGIFIPGIAGGTTGMDLIPTQQSADRLLTALDKLASPTPAKFDSPAFGPLSHEDRIKLNLRHAELHLGYLKY